MRIEPPGSAGNKIFQSLALAEVPNRRARSNRVRNHVKDLELAR
jgi:hypothetical protein